MDDEVKKTDHTTEAAPDPGTLTDKAEPWLPIETKLVVVSVVIGVAALMVLATLVHIFLLGGES